MRIWSLHPKYIDNKGLVALWRETLLAKKVLEGRTKGYRNHPQLNRFKMSNKPLDAINFYLQHVKVEADARSYNFDKSKFTPIESIELIEVTTMQLEFERKHLLRKVKIRDKIKHKEILAVLHFETHPLFKLIEGEIETWEKI